MSDVIRGTTTPSYGVLPSPFWLFHFHMAHTAVSKSSSPSPSTSDYATQTTSSLEQVGCETLTSLSEEWSKLAMQEPFPEPFFQPYWISAFAETFHKATPISLLTVRHNGELAGILPMKRESRFFGKFPANTLRSLSGIHSSRFDFMCQPKRRDELTRAAWLQLKAEKSWDVFEAQHVPHDGRLPGILKYAKEDGYLIAQWPSQRSPYLDFPPPGGDPFKNSPPRYKSSRNRLKGYHKKLAQFGEPHLEVTNQFQEHLFERFIALEKSGWKGKHGGAIGNNATATEFYRTAMSAASRQGHFRMYSLVLKNKPDQPIAMDMGLLINNRYYSPKIAYDESYAKCSPGILLGGMVLTDLASQGIDRFDFLGSQSRHKSIWSLAARPHYHCYIFRPTLMGRARHALISHVLPRIRKIKYSLYGDPQDVSARTSKK